MQVSKVWLSIIGCLIVLPSTVSAQGSITGTVRDTSGAVLPGVTVEASSDALIEKARSAVTDGSGQYRIVDLRAGTYSVTFTLTGFNTSKREGVEIAGTFTASINAEMKVGALEETVVVSGESPILETAEGPVAASPDQVEEAPGEDMGEEVGAPA